MYLNYQKMTFTDTGRLGQSVEVYLKLNKTEEIHDSPMLENSIVTESEKRFLMFK